MDLKLGRQIMSSVGPKTNLPDTLEKGFKMTRERLMGVDLSIFDPTIQYYAECMGERVTREDALQRALNKKLHKQAWFDRERNTLDDIFHFYQESNFYPFRQPWHARFGGMRWYRHLVRHIEHPSILEYGCGSAILTEYLSRKCPDARYTVADIPSVTLDFVTWKKAHFGFPYTILTIGSGKAGIPLREGYDLIVCQDVLEHTPNPLEIVEAFVSHLRPLGVLLIDFIYAPGGENLNVSVAQREDVKAFLKDHLVTLKAIDAEGKNNGLYVNDS